MPCSKQRKAIISLSTFFLLVFDSNKAPKGGGDAPAQGLSETHIAEPSFQPQPRLKCTHSKNPHSALKLRAEPGIMLLWCDIFAVLSASITRTGPQGVGSTLRPAAFVSPGLFYSITEKIAIAFSSKFECIISELSSSKQCLGIYRGVLVGG